MTSPRLEGPLLLLLLVLCWCCSCGAQEWSQSGSFVTSCAGECGLPAAEPTSASRPLIGLFGGAMAPGELIASEDVPLFAELLKATGYTCNPYLNPDCVPQGTVLSLTTDSNCTGTDWLQWAPFWINPSTFDPETILPRSATTVCFVARPSEGSPDWDQLVSMVQSASLVWFTGGDQSTYFRYWANSPLSQAISKHVQTTGRPVGGESAGLAILGNGAVFAALGKEELFSKEALIDPYNPLVTLVPQLFNFGASSGLQRVITDTHFMQRNRMGRLLTFVSRLKQDGNLTVPVGLGISEHTGYLLDAATGVGIVGGRGPVNVVVMQTPPLRCQPVHTLLLQNVITYHLSSGAQFDLLNLSTSTPSYAHSYSLSVDSLLRIQSSGNDDRIY